MPIAPTPEAPCGARLYKLQVAAENYAVEQLRQISPCAKADSLECFGTNIVKFAFRIAR